MPTKFNVKSSFFFKKNDYETVIDGNTLKMTSKTAKGVKETFDDLKSKGCDVKMIGDRSILQTLEGRKEKEIIEKMRSDLDAAVATAVWPIKMSYEEVKE